MASEDKTINVAIKYSTQGADTAQRTQKQLLAEIENDTKRAQDIIKQYSKGVQTDQTEVDAITKRLYNNINEYQNKFAQNSKSLEQQFHALRMAGRELEQIGTGLTVGGGLLTAGLVANANEYVKAMGQTTELSGEWLQQEKDIKEAQLSIGQSTAQIILPGLKEGASLMQQIAAIIQANPWIVQAALTVGTAMTVIGVASMVVGRIVSVVADFGLLLTKFGVMQAEGTLKAGTGSLGGSAGAGATWGTVTLIATAVIIGAELGLALGNKIGETMTGGKYGQAGPGNFGLADVFVASAMGAQALVYQLVKLVPGSEGAAKGMGDLFTSIDKFLATVLGANKILNVINANNPDKATAGTGLGGTTDPNRAAEVDSFINYEKQIQTTTDTYEAQRKDTIAQYEQQVQQITEAYESQRASIIANFERSQVQQAQSFALSQANALANYQNQVAQAEYQFHVQQQRAARAHAVEMARLEQDHSIKMNDIAATRDALGLVKEQQSYELEKTRKQQDYDTQRQQAEQDEQIRLADMKRNFDLQRQEALVSYQLQQQQAQQNEQVQLATLDANHKTEMAKLDQQEQDKLTKMDAAYKKQIQDLQTNYVDQLDRMTQTILGNSEAYTRYMEVEAQRFQNWLNQLQSRSVGGSGSGSVGSGSGTGSGSGSGGVLQRRAEGGYARFLGEGEPGDNEFVVRASAARAMEAVMGGKLSQANMLAAVMAGRAGAGAANAGGNYGTININGRSLTLQEVRKEITNAFHDYMTDLLPAFGA